MSTAQITRLTADDLLLMPDESRFELINGELVERKMSEESSWVSGEIFRLIAGYIASKALGRAFPADNGFRCFSDDGEKIRRPDASVVLNSRISGPLAKRGYTRVAPNLVVEVVSPGDTAYEVSEKVEDWLSAGVDEVWVVMPPSRTVTVHSPAQSPRTYSADEEIVSTTGAAGFRCRVAEFFPPMTDEGE